MIAGTLTGLSLVVAVAIEPSQIPLSEAAARMQMSLQQKNAVIHPLMRSATDCIVRAVVSNPKFSNSMPASDINELIVASMEICIEPMRAMIDAYDRLHGAGTGHAFFMGPYLDVLPAAVSRQVRGNLP